MLVDPAPGAWVGLEGCDLVASLRAERSHDAVAIVELDRRDAADARRLVDTPADVVVDASRPVGSADVLTGCGFRSEDGRRVRDVVVVPATAPAP